MNAELTEVMRVIITIPGVPAAYVKEAVGTIAIALFGSGLGFNVIVEAEPTPSQGKPKPKAKAVKVGKAPNQELILKNLHPDPTVNVDSLVQSTGLTRKQINMALYNLMQAKRVKKTATGFYHTVGEEK